jgi:hypothetical protein
MLKGVFVDLSKMQNTNSTTEEPEELALAQENNALSYPPLISPDQPIAHIKRCNGSSTVSSVCHALVTSFVNIQVCHRSVLSRKHPKPH